MEQYRMYSVIAVWGCVLCILQMTSVYSIEVQSSVSEVSALIDTNVSLSCDVTTQDSVQFVLWKKILSEGHDLVLTHNNDSLYDVDKYGVAYPHGLVIYGVQTEDEAVYQCEVNQVAAKTSFKVLVPATNVTIDMQGDPRVGGVFNLTCHAQRARPPATLTWFRGSSDVTARAVSYTSFYHADGYGDSQSLLPMPEEWDDGKDLAFRCVASVGDSSGDVTAFIFPYTGAANSVKALPILLVLSVFIGLSVDVCMWNTFTLFVRAFAGGSRF